jgi:alpha-tubulin suppressor-like RCC1 family protein
MKFIAVSFAALFGLSLGATPCYATESDPLLNASVVSAGDNHTCAVVSGSAWCWGYNYYGQLGNGSTTDSPVAVKVQGLPAGTVTAISAGHDYTCAVVSGSAWCWGGNGSGQLGNGTYNYYRSPVQVTGLTAGVTAISTSVLPSKGGIVMVASHTCALVSGAAWCWGNNYYGQLGNGSTSPTAGITTPVPVTGLATGVTAISAGSLHTCAVVSSGSAQCWGYNRYGQLGTGNTTSSSTPVQVTGLTAGVTAIDAGGYHTCALVSGSARCWGSNSDGQLGTGNTTNSSTPVQVSGLTEGVTAISAGDYHTCAVVSGSALCWGYNASGQLGIGSTTGSSSTQVQVIGPRFTDVVWRNFSSGANTVWLSAASAATQSVATVSDGSWQIVGVGDYSGDGTADLFWRHASSGVNAIWKSADSATQQSVATVGDLNWKVAGSGDFNRDGRSDILWRNLSNGYNTIWLSAASNTSQTMAAVADQTWQVVGVGDFDKDGYSDIFWRNSSTGANTIWRSGNSGTPLSVAKVGDLAWKVVGIGDFDGEGTSDVLWRNTTTGANTIWKAANSASQQAVTAVGDQAWTVATVGDVDADGRVDIVWRNTRTGDNAIWKAGSSATQQAMTPVSDLNWKIVGSGWF